MSVELIPKETPGEVVMADSYDTATAEGGWDSPERAQALVEQYVVDGSIVLDVGIGTGQAVKGYAEKGAAIIGLDHDPEMLAAAQSVTGESGSMRQSDINGSLPIEDILGKVDVAQAIGVLEFASDIGDVIDQVKASLKPCGIFVFTIEISLGTTDDLVQHYPDANLTIYRHTVDEVHKLLADRGLSLIHEAAYDGYKRGDTMTGKVPYHIFLAQKNKL